MPAAHKRPLPWPTPDDSEGRVAARHTAAASGDGGRGGGGASHEKDGEASARQGSPPHPGPRDGDPDDKEVGGGCGGGDGTDTDGESSLSPSAGSMEEFMLVKLAEIRKEVQCPICLGIIRKTRTVMECLHRFCRDCIDKSMRLGNNECPACRTHCASRRSLRDDPKYDALIAALYPDIDKYEEEELAFNEQERIRNQKIQENIEETFRRQSEAMGKKRSAAKATATVLSRKYRRNMRARGRGRTITPDIAPAVSDEEDREEENANEVTKAPSSADDRSPDLRHKRCRKTSASQASPARTIGSSDRSFEENDELVGGKEFLATSPLRGEMLAWGKNGTRSQNRHGSTGSNGRIGRSGRIAKLVDHLRNTDEMDKEFQLYLVLLPVDGQAIPNLEKPYISCRPTLSIQHLVQLIALQLSRKVEELEMYIRMDHHHGRASSTGEFDGLERLREDKLLSDLHPSFASSNGDLELRYALKTRD